MNTGNIEIAHSAGSAKKGAVRRRECSGAGRAWLALVVTSLQSSRRWTLRWLALAGVLLAVILVPFVLFEAPLAEFARRVQRAGSAAPLTVALVTALLLASDVVLPIPSSIVSTAAGYLLGVPLGTSASLVGMTAGCLLGYAMGVFAGRPALKRFFPADEVARFEQLAARTGDWALALARPVPVLAEASVILAGVARLPRARFLGITTAANFAVSATYATAGALSATSGSLLIALAVLIAVPLAARWISR